MPVPAHDSDRSGTLVRNIIAELPGDISLLWMRPLPAALRACDRLRTRWDALSRSVKVQYMSGWGQDPEAADWLSEAFFKGDFKATPNGTRHGVRLRDAPHRGAAFTGKVIQPRDDYVVLYSIDGFLKIRKVIDGAEGFIAKKHHTQHTTDVAVVEDLAAAACYLENKPFSVKQMQVYPVPPGLRELLLMRTQLITEGQWITGQAFKRSIFKEGRMVNYGARKGREILPETCATPFHPLTEHILSLLNYPPPEGEGEVWRHISVAWNHYRKGCGTMPHKNWMGTRRIVYIHFGASPTSSCLFSFYDRATRRLQESRRVRSAIMVLGDGLDSEHLHSVTDVTGDHYSMVIREVSPDWRKVRDFKLRGSTGAPMEDSDNEEKYILEEIAGQLAA